MRATILTIIGLMISAAILIVGYFVFTNKDMKELQKAEEEDFYS